MPLLILRLGLGGSYQVSLFVFFFVPMAPRRRLTQRGQTRMDAALDAMAPYGFPNKLVRTTVSQLLKVYGGKAGWVFIEDSAYTLLIDTLLQQQSNPSPEDCLIEACPGDSSNEASPASCSNRALVPCSNPEISDDVPLTNQTVVDTASAASGTENQFLIKGVGTESETHVPVRPVVISSVVTEPDCSPVGNLALGENHGSSPRLVASLCNKRRRPCYGWISSDDDEELTVITRSKVSDMLANDGVN